MGILTTVTVVILIIMVTSMAHYIIAIGKINKALHYEVYNLHCRLRESRIQSALLEQGIRNKGFCPAPWYDAARTLLMEQQKKLEEIKEVLA